MKTKICSRCKNTKPTTDFYKNKNNKDGLSFYCKICAGKIDKKGRSWREMGLWKLYKLTLENYNILYNKQKGCCAVCGRHQSELAKPLFVDHSHITKEIRGLLCGKCNSGLGLFNDNIKVLKKAIMYLEK